MNGEGETNHKGQNTPVLVIGAGIAGIEASLLLANSGRKVYLVEKASYIGGNTIKFEEVFPNMDCATCMIAPKQQELLANENIEFLRLSEVEAIHGSLGDFTVKVRKRASYVNSDNCIGCNACFDPCPVEADNEFEEGLSKRKAIYIPCAGALPNIPVIDTENCLGFKGQECRACQEACVFEAIDFTQQDEEAEVEVGAIVVATGFSMFDPGKTTQYGYKKLSNVYSAMEIERICASNGATQGQIILQSGEPPKSVAIIHCVGREEKGYCSSVCCMASLKLSHFLKKKLPEVKITHFYSDLCIPGKAYQKFYEDTKETGARFVRSVKTEVAINGKGTTIKYETETGSKGDLIVDMVILLPAMETGSDAKRFAEMLNIPQDNKGFFVEEHQLLGQVASAVEGVFVIGCAGGPKSISESIVQSEAAVGKILSALVPGRKLELEVRVSEISENFCTGCKTCIDVCPYGAITFDESRRISVVNEVLCHGCGSCAAACPSGAAKLKHFTFPQIYQELKEVLR